MCNPLQCVVTVADLLNRPPLTFQTGVAVRLAFYQNGFFYFGKTARIVDFYPVRRVDIGVGEAPGHMTIGADNDAGHTG